MNFSNVSFVKAVGSAKQLDASFLPEICFSGRSNVGKSSLINKITERKNLVRVSNKPGKTVTVNFYKLDNIHLVDLPGYGYAKVSFDEKERWADLMETYFKSERNISYVFQLVDMRHMPTDFDLSMISFLKETELPFSVILTKSDKLNKAEYQKNFEDIKYILNESFGEIDIIPFSAVSGEGVETVRSILENFNQGENYGY